MSGRLAPAFLDRLLGAQLAVAWAGERGEDEPRLGWWGTDMVAEYGGEDVYRQLMPGSWRWAVFQTAREAARRVDAATRSVDAQPDRLYSLFRWGFGIDEQVEDRLSELKRSGRAPLEALPALAELVGGGWDAERFAEWLGGFAKVRAEGVPSGRRLPGAPPEDVELRLSQLLGGLLPLGESYPAPHHRVRVEGAA